MFILILLSEIIFPLKKRHIGVKCKCIQKYNEAVGSKSNVDRACFSADGFHIRQ